MQLAQHVVGRRVLARHQTDDVASVLRDLAVDPSLVDGLEAWSDEIDHVLGPGRHYLGFETGLDRGAGEVLYAAVRALRPAHVIETGTASGVSATFVGAALVDNGAGELWSLDLPREEAVRRFGRYGAVDEPERPLAWALPDSIRDALGDRFHLHTGDVVETLPPLLDELGRVDLFLHDDLHEPPHMTWEFELVWPRLTPGGILACDDAEAAWISFCRRRGRPEGIRTIGGMGAIRKVR